MMFDFDSVVNRRNTGSYKWDIPENELPMWVADMEFQTAPCIIEALAKRVSHGVFGYNIIPDEWYDAYINWWRSRHNFTIEKDWLIFSTGVIPSISSIVRKLTTPNENVVLLTPVYNIFFNSTINNGCRVLECPLSYSDYTYSINWNYLEECLSDPQTSLLIFCNPHNPIGKIWSHEDIKRIGDLCAQYHVTVISDEIHCDITEPGSSYIPFASVSETCKNVSITCIAPTKCFNIAGLQTSAVFIPDSYLHHKVWRALNTDEVAEPNSFAVTATIAGFNNGGSWLDSLNNYISENRRIATEFIQNNIPGIHVVSQDATYLLWLDCSQITPDATPLTEFIRATTGLYLTDGNEYGSAGKPFIRMNIACPREYLSDGLTRLQKGISQYK